MDNIIRIEDITGDVYLINLDDISFLSTDLTNVKIKFKNTPDEHTLFDITQDSLDYLKELLKKKPRKKKLNE